MKSLSWPPNFSIKKHPRSRHVKLKTSPQYGLEFVVPLHFNLDEIPIILEQNKAWIEKQLLKIQMNPLVEDITLPNELIFPILNQRWQIDYIESKSKLQMLARPHQALVLLGKIENKVECVTLLTHWIKSYARLQLPLKLAEISQRIHLPYHSVTIRDQTTRWGSCSATKSINLNYKLLLLPASLATHVMIHELCHTQEMNHSDKFWRWVERFDSDWKIHRKTLKKADEWIPKWIK